DLTCWGDGKLNFRRASAAALQAGCAPLLTTPQVARLVQIRSASPDVKQDQLLAQIDASEAAAVKLSERLTDESSCHGLWVVAHGPRRDWYQFSVRDATDPDNVRTFTF